MKLNNWVRREFDGKSYITGVCKDTGRRTTSKWFEGNDIPDDLETVNGEKIELVQEIPE